MISSYDVHLVSKYNLLQPQFVPDESKILHIHFANRTFGIVAPWFLSILMNEFLITEQLFLYMLINEWVSILCTIGNVHVVFY